jgi:hypothetical protein
MSNTQPRKRSLREDIDAIDLEREALERQLRAQAIIAALKRTYRGKFTKAQYDVLGWMMLIAAEYESDVCFLNKHEMAAATGLHVRHIEKCWTDLTALEAIEPRHAKRGDPLPHGRGVFRKTRRTFLVRARVSEDASPEQTAISTAVSTANPTVNPTVIAGGNLDRSNSASIVSPGAESSWNSGGGTPESGVADATTRGAHQGRAAETHGVGPRGPTMGANGAARAGAPASAASSSSDTSAHAAARAYANAPRGAEAEAGNEGGGAAMRVVLDWRARCVPPAEWKDIPAKYVRDAAYWLGSGFTEQELYRASEGARLSKHNPELKNGKAFGFIFRNEERIRGFLGEADRRGVTDPPPPPPAHPGGVSGAGGVNGAQDENPDRPENVNSGTHYGTNEQSSPSTVGRGMATLMNVLDEVAGVPRKKRGAA